MVYFYFTSVQGGGGGLQKASLRKTSSMCSTLSSNDTYIRGKQYVCILSFSYIITFINSSYHEVLLTLLHFCVKISSNHIKYTSDLLMENIFYLLLKWHGISRLTVRTINSYSTVEQFPSPFQYCWHGYKSVSYTHLDVYKRQ